jgi:chitinase
MRKDGGAQAGEFMTDEQGCISGKHQLCCPPNTDLLPTCGWYTHNNGRCDQRCPSTMLEIGSNNMYCRSGYQAACCTVASNAIQLHNTCTWSQSYPNCDSSNCASVGALYDHEYASSAAGSGGAYCNEIGGRDIWGWPPTLPREHRKLCCREDIQDMRWKDCQWYERYGLMKNDWPSDACYAGCPDSMVRVAMDEGDNCSRGSRARCCVSGYVSITKRANAQNQEFEFLIDRFLGNPRCTTTTNTDDYRYQETLADYIRKLIYASPDTTMTGIWDSRMDRSNYANLKFAKLTKWAVSDIEATTLGSTRLPRAIMCGMANYNSIIGQNGGRTCKCDNINCGTDFGLRRRDWPDPLLFNITYVSGEDQDEHGEILERGLIVKREGESYRTISVLSAATGRVVTLTLSMMAVSGAL